MPLEKGKSQAAFEKNLKTELAHGKPKEQALAIAYSQQRRGDVSIADSINKAIDLASKLK